MMKNIIVIALLICGCTYSNAQNSDTQDASNFNKLMGKMLPPKYLVVKGKQGSKERPMHKIFKSLEEKLSECDIVMIDYKNESVYVMKDVAHLRTEQHKNHGKLPYKLTVGLDDHRSFKFVLRKGVASDRIVLHHHKKIAEAKWEWVPVAISETPDGKKEAMAAFHEHFPEVKEEDFYFSDDTFGKKAKKEALVRSPRVFFLSRKNGGLILVNPYIHVRTNSIINKTNQFKQGKL